MNNRIYEKKLAEAKSSRPWLAAILEWQDGFGLIIFFWLLVISFLGSIVLLFAGIAHWNSWLVFCGLLSLRLFVYLIEIGDGMWDFLDPPTR